MAAETDPLLALRAAIKSKHEIAYTPDTSALVLSPTLTLPKSTPTRLRKPGATAADPHAAPADFFSVEAVYLAWRLRDAPGADYMRQAREHGLALGFVSVTERKGVVDWLEERAPEHERIVPLIAADTTTPPGTPPRAGTSASASTLPATPAPGGSGAPSSPTKRRYVTDASDVQVVKKIKQAEIELQDRNTVLRGDKPNNFSAIRAVYTEKLKKMREASKPGAVAPAPAPTLDPKLQARKARNMYPIIIISSSPTALITMHNVRRFLQEAVFEPSQEARTRAAAEGNVKPEDMIPIYRRRTTIDPSGRETQKDTRYCVVDSVEALSKFGADAWDRVVCVMTTGQAWQFRSYKWNEPRTLFHHVKGIYVSWANDPPNAKIADWNVTPLKIDPNRRHVDKSVVAEFWKVLDTWTLQHKPWLMK